MPLHTISLVWPKKQAPQQAIYPIFIPFAGCKQRCIFCAQHIQSGKNICEHSGATQSVLAAAAQDLAQRKTQQKEPLEIAFYGGTFTALPEQDFTACLQFAMEQKKLGHSTGARCSTRPDAITSHKLQRLTDAGFTTIELGIQSFHSEALAIAKRNYTKEIALEACALVRQHAFTLGVQLMPGMPGVSPTIFVQDTHTALMAKADFLRMYPCQVIGGTELEHLWRKGEFTPWSLEQTLESLSEAWLHAHLAHIPVIRMGLAPEVSLEEHRLAGPHHPALGNLVQAKALFKYVTQETKKAQRTINIQQPPSLISPSLKGIKLPLSCQGYFWGHKQNLTPLWSEYGIQKQNTTWHNANYIEIIF